MITIGILIAIVGILSYYRDETGVFMAKAKIKLLDLWISILSGKK